MKTVEYPSSACCNKSEIIYLKLNDRCSSGRCFPDNKQRIFAPLKVIFPHLLTRVEKGNTRVTDGINTVYCFIFVQIAIWATERKVIGIRGSIQTSGSDVVALHIDDNIS